MANPEYSENPDRKYLQKGKHGIAASIRFPKGSAGKVNVKYPHATVKKGFKFMKKGT